MKKLLLFWLLLPFVALGQAEFDEGIKITGGQPDNTTPTYFTTTAIGGLQEKIPSAYIAKTATTIDINGVSQDLSSSRTWRTAQADTGVLTFNGLSTNSATTINIGSVFGVVANNESVPDTPSHTLVNYAGASDVTVTTVGSGQASYVMLSSTGVISFQTTFPTSAERKAKIWLGKVSHPAGTITLIVNEPDYITSPMAFSRDILQSLGGYINMGVYPVENGANLNMNVTGGSIMGDGANFVNSRTSPNFLSMGPNVVATFSERTQSGGVTAGVTSVNVGFYDVAGTVTAIPGPGATSTIRYIYAIPGLGYVVQYGQTTYSSLSNAIAAVGKETFVKWSNLDNNSILIGVLAARKDATSLRTQDGQAQFFQADRLGGLIGSTAGVSTGTMQTAYNNSPVPQVVVTDALGAMTWQNGRALNTSTVTEWKNIAGTTTASVDGNGLFSGTALVIGSGLSYDPIGYGGALPRTYLGRTVESSFLMNVQDTGSYQVRRYGSAFGPALRVGAAMGTIASPTVSTSGQLLGSFQFEAFTGVGTGTEGFNSVARVTGLSSALATSTTASGHLTFETRSGAGALTERARVTDIGNFIVGSMTDNVTDIAQFNGSLLARALKFRNVANTFTSDFTNTNTAARTYTLPDASGTVLLNGTGMSLSGNQTFAGTKTSSTIPGGHCFVLTENSGNATTAAIFTQSLNNGVGVWSEVTGSGTAINTLMGGTNANARGIVVNNNNTNAGVRGLLINNTTAATGKPFQYTKNDVEKAFIDNTGNISGQNIIAAAGVVRLFGYTVATLPTGTVGDTAYVTDATAPTYLTTVAGGGAVKCPVFFDGTNWVAH